MTAWVRTRRAREAAQDISLESQTMARSLATAKLGLGAVISSHNDRATVERALLMAQARP